MSGRTDVVKDATRRDRPAAGRRSLGCGWRLLFPGLLAPNRDAAGERDLPWPRAVRASISATAPASENTAVRGARRLASIGNGEPRRGDRRAAAPRVRRISTDVDRQRRRAATGYFALSANSTGTATWHRREALATRLVGRASWPMDPLSVAAEFDLGSELPTEVATGDETQLVSELNDWRRRTSSTRGELQTQRGNTRYVGRSADRDQYTTFREAIGRPALAGMSTSRTSSTARGKTRLDNPRGRQRLPALRTRLNATGQNPPRNERHDQHRQLQACWSASLPRARLRALDRGFRRADRIAGDRCHRRGLRAQGRDARTPDRPLECNPTRAGRRASLVRGSAASNRPEKLTVEQRPFVVVTGASSGIGLELANARPGGVHPSTTPRTASSRSG